MPHYHPTDESITVLSGAFMAGMGDTWNDSSMATLKAGEFAKMPKLMHHYAGSKGETIIQIHGTGPFAITYVNPKDDPRKKVYSVEDRRPYGGPSLKPGRLTELA